VISAASTYTNNLAGISNSILPDNNATHYGVKNTLSGSGTGDKHGTYSNLTGTGSGDHYGTRSLLSGTGNGVHSGVSSTLSGSGSGIHYGVFSSMEGTGTGNRYGLRVNVTGTPSSGSSIHAGISTSMSSSGTGPRYGAFHTIGGSGSGSVFGEFVNMASSTNADQFGYYVSSNNTGSGNKYGLRSLISNTSGGTHYGIHSEALKAGSYAAYFVGDVSIGTTPSNNYVFPASRGTNTYIMQTDGTGNVSWVNPTSLSTSSPLWNIESTTTNASNITDNMYHSGEIGIGHISTDLVASPLHVKSITSIYGYSATIDNTHAKSGLDINLSGSASALVTGINIDNEHTGTANKISIYNAMRGSGSGNVTGLRNWILNTSGYTSYITGVSNEIYSNNNGIQKGTYNYMTGTGSGAKYGTHTDIDPAAGGTHYGIYSDVTKAGSYAGYFLGDVSIGTTTANEYILPPSRGTNNQIMQTDGSGDVSWVDPSSIISDDPDWFLETTTNAPTAITDDIYHTGNVAIGKNAAGYKLDVEESGTAQIATRIYQLSSSQYPIGLQIYEGGSGANEHTGLSITTGGNHNYEARGIYNQVSNTGNGVKYGLINHMNTGGGGIQYGVYTTSTSTHSSTDYGTYNDISHNGSGWHYGVYNRLVSIGPGSRSGVANNLEGPAQLIGTDNSVTGVGNNNQFIYGTLNAVHKNGGGASSEIYGTKNDLQSISTGYNYGVYNSLAGDGSSSRYGVYTGITGNSGTGPVYGNYNGINVTTTTAIHGNYNTIYNSSTGGIYGVRSVLNNASSGPSYGAYHDLSSGGTGTRTGVFNEISGTGSINEHYGMRTDISSSGANSKLGTYNNLNPSGNGVVYGTYNYLYGSAGSSYFGTFNNFSGTNATASVGTSNYFDAAISATAVKSAMLNYFYNNGSGKQQGVYQIFQNSSSSDQYGMTNDFQTSGSGEKVGLLNYLGTSSANANGVLYGVRNELGTSVTSASAKYGVYNEFPASVPGTHYGIYSDVTRAGSYSGFFLGNVYVGTTALNGYNLPASDGSNGQVIQTDGSGQSSWATPTAGDITGVTAGDGLTGGGTSGTVSVNVVATNGLTDNANDIRLGGTLIQATTITQGTNSMTFNLNSTGDFVIQDAGVNHFEIRDNGTSYFGEDTYWNDGSTAGTTLARMYDSADDGVFEVYRNGTTNHRLWGNGMSYLNTQLADVDFRISGDLLTNLFFVNGGSNMIGINDITPTAMLHIKQSGSGEEGLAIENDGDTDTWRWEVGGNDLLISFNGTNVGYWDDATGNYVATSDQRMKKDIEDQTDGALAGVLNLEPVFYRLNHAEDDSEKAYGFLAQNVQKYFPELTRNNEDGHLGLHYPDFGVLAIKAIQEQQVLLDEKDEKIDELSKTVEELLRRMSALEAKMN